MSDYDKVNAAWTANSQFPTCFPTVDVAIVKGGKVLMGKKPGKDKWQFVGGFADPDCQNYETDATREVREETGVTIYQPEYICSSLIDDSRYRNSKDKIKTLFFVAKYYDGEAKAEDDIVDVRWLNIFDLDSSNVVGQHIYLVIRLQQLKRFWFYRIIHELTNP